MTLNVMPIKNASFLLQHADPFSHSYNIGNKTGIYHNVTLEVFILQSTIITGSFTFDLFMLTLKMK